MIEHSSKEIKYRLSDLGVQIGNIAIEYITELEVENEKLRALNAEAKNIGITQQLNLDLRKIEELRAENAKLKQIPTWHDLRKDPTDYPTEENMLVRVILKDGSELICTTHKYFLTKYFLTEDEIGYKGYGSSIIQFSQKNSTEDWVDDNDIIAWCEISKFEGVS